MTREELEAEARKFIAGRLSTDSRYPASEHKERQVARLADWAERIQREAVAEDLRRMRKLEQWNPQCPYCRVKIPYPATPEHLDSCPFGSVLAALDARSKEERMEDRQAGIDQGQQ